MPETAPETSRNEEPAEPSGTPDVMSLADPPARTDSVWASSVVRLGVLAALLLLGLVGYWQLLAGNDAFIPIAATLVLPLLLVGLVLMLALRHELHWNRPTRRLARLLHEANTVGLPVAELNDVRGGLSDVADEAARLVLELRRVRRQTSDLEAEVRERIASRTDALERQIGSLRQQATRDALTGLHNRRLFESSAFRQFDLALETGEPLALLMIDVDRFKQLNDTLGHDAGDQLLRDISQIIKSGVRGEDSAFRLGGDEFAVLMPGMTREAAEARCAQWVRLVDGLARTMKPVDPPGLSVGVAVTGEGARTLAELAKQADVRLYDVKAERKRVA